MRERRAVGNTKPDHESMEHILERLRPTSSRHRDAIEIVRELVACEMGHPHLQTCDSGTRDESYCPPYHIFDDFDWHLFSVFCYT